MFAVAVVTAATAEKLTAIALCLCCRSLCCPSAARAWLFSCWNCQPAASEAPPCLYNSKIRLERRSFALSLMLLWVEEETPQEYACLLASLPNELSALSYLLVQPEMQPIYGKSSCKWRHVYTNHGITSFIPATTVFLLGHFPGLNRNNCREISAQLLIIIIKQLPRSYSFLQSPLWHQWLITWIGVVWLAFWLIILFYSKATKVKFISCHLWSWVSPWPYYFG